MDPPCSTGCSFRLSIVGRVGPWHIRSMAKADLSVPRPLRLSVALLVLFVHVAAILGLLRAFTPDFTNAVVQNVASVLP